MKAETIFKPRILIQIFKRNRKKVHIYQNSRSTSNSTQWLLNRQQQTINSGVFYNKEYSELMEAIQPMCFSFCHQRSIDLCLFTLQLMFLHAMGIYIPYVLFTFFHGWHKIPDTQCWKDSFCSEFVKVSIHSQLSPRQAARQRGITGEESMAQKAGGCKQRASLSLLSLLGYEPIGCATHT